MPSSFKVIKPRAAADYRGRITLGHTVQNKQYRVSQNAEGEILLVPIADISEREAWLYANPEAMESVRRGLSDAANGKTHDLGSFAQFAELELED